ncbi:MAG: PHP domain-containing protein [Nitrospinota bacterium]|nr:PHP domain-containing protein [Nitrospinota bacterium]
MNRRHFLKYTAGFTLGTAAVGLGLPVSAKKQIATPVAGLITENFLDLRIQENILQLKQKTPSLKIGETHCHSNFSDGMHTIKKIMTRATVLGLDFMIFTEHVTLEKFPFDRALGSFREQWQQIRQWDHKSHEPVTLYPAFEVSTAQGHLILIFPQDYLNPKMYPDLKQQFGHFGSEMAPMEQPARRAKDMGGMAIIPHPEVERSYPFGATVPFIRENLIGLVDGIEDISTGHGYEANFSGQLNLASIGSSDDHLNLILGTTVTGYDSNRHVDLLSAIKTRETQAIKVEESLNPLFAGLRKIL